VGESKNWLAGLLPKKSVNFHMIGYTKVDFRTDSGHL